MGYNQAHCHVRGFIEPGCFSVNDRVAPATLAISAKIRTEEIRDTKKAGDKKNILKNIFIHGTKNRKIFVHFFDTEKNTLEEIIILEFDNDLNPVSKTSAREAEWKNNKWIFYNLSTYRLDNTFNIVGKPAFYREKEFGLDESPEDFKKLRKHTDLMSYKELKTHIRRFSGSGLKTARELLVDLHYKISFAFTSLVVILVAAPLALLIHRGGILTGIGISIFVALSYYAFSAISLALGKAGLIPPFISAWTANFTFLGLGIYLMRKRN